MQTTLLTLGIAIILVLVAALVGPGLIDWEQYHAELEQQARQIVGLPVRVRGAIDVRLLPTPSVTLGDVQIGAADSSRKVSARGLSMELSLGNLMRGEFRANQVTLDRPEVRATLDKSGALQFPGLAFNFDLDRLAIERLTIVDGQLLLTDAASGGKLAVEGLNVSGEAGSLLGPYKLEGTFTAGGEHYAYRFASNRRNDDGSMKVRLGIASDERALDFQSDGTLWFDAGSPRFEGAAALSPLAGSKDARGHVILTEQWKVVAGKVKASPSAVQFDQMEMSYGPQARVVRANGEATLSLGRDPRLSATVAARQIDFDRLLPSGDEKRSPFETVKLLIEELAPAPASRLPVHVAVGIDSLMAGGAAVSSLHGDIASTADGWTLNRLEMRAPGATQILVNGKFTVLADQQKAEFQGP
ncbi:MAG: AsmA family protein, partial [Bradyrhizobiaceae bacterium]|nr:AsmA family protein [Bradyrhizobiaceae bacterium]